MIADGVGEQPSTPSRNRPAKASLFFAGSGMAALANSATGIAWVNPMIFVGLAMPYALAAAPQPASSSGTSVASAAAVSTGTGAGWRYSGSCLAG
ncbi:hypothetical protein AB0C21_33020 [Spirillospora sp. NPDC049024]